MSTTERMVYDGWIRWSFVAAGRDVDEDEIPRWMEALERGAPPERVRSLIASKG